MSDNKEKDIEQVLQSEWCVSLCVWCKFWIATFLLPALAGAWSEGRCRLSHYHPTSGGVHTIPIVNTWFMCAFPSSPLQPPSHSWIPCSQSMLRLSHASLDLDVWKAACVESVFGSLAMRQCHVFTSWAGWELGLPASLQRSLCFSVPLSATVWIFPWSILTVMRSHWSLCNDECLSICPTVRPSGTLAFVKYRQFAWR